MTLSSFKNQFQERLQQQYPETEINSFFFWLIDCYLNLSRTDWLINPQQEISNDGLEKLENATLRLLKEEPIQYIIGETEFYGLPFKVNPNVLIPRPETEELVSWIIDEVKSQKPLNQKLSILDIGTGSGSIPICLKKSLPNATLNTIDVSSGALKTAKENAEMNEVDIHFIQQDILSTTQLDSMFDIIVSNPPYVRNLEKEEIKNNVLENEPHLALFVDDNNPLVFYDKIANLAKNHLNTNGTLFFEINEYLGKETVDLLTSKGFKTIELKKDLFGKDRMIKASL